MKGERQRALDPLRALADRRAEHGRRTEHGLSDEVPTVRSHLEDEQTVFFVVAREIGRSGYRPDRSAGGREINPAEQRRTLADLEQQVR